MSIDIKTDINDNNTVKSIEYEEGVLLQEKESEFEEIYELPLGKELDIEMTYKITSENESNFIVVAGPSDCGKTTLITTIYQKFQKGPIINYNFAGSETLQGFEQRAFLTRIDSNMGESQTPKTRRGAFDVLHLKLFNSKSGEFKNLLITDFSGEDYSSAIGNVDMMRREFGVIRSANVIFIIIDGDKISNNRLKFGEIENALDLLSTIIDAGLLSKYASIEVSISKFDVLVSRVNEHDEIERLLKSIQTRFKERFTNRISKMKFSKTAAMPNENKKIPVGYGIDEILVSCVESNCSCFQERNEVLLPIKLTSQFNLYKMRHVEVTK